VNMLRQFYDEVSTILTPEESVTVVHRAKSNTSQSDSDSQSVSLTGPVRFAVFTDWRIF
jgi:hypothetical protein